MAYIQEINKNTEDSQQTSPAYVLTFVRFSNRDVYNYKSTSSLETREPPLAVINDAVSINIQNTKSNPIPTLNCILRQGDVNYLTAISPGDFVIANIVNWEKKAVEIRQRSVDGKPINRIGDGFKGLFKVLNVNMNLSVGSNGEKQYYVQVTARGFDEFNNILYFNPALVQEISATGGGVSFLNNFNNFKDLVQKKDTNNVQELVKTIIQRTIGQGFLIKSKPGTKLNQVLAYEIPSTVANLLNIPKAKSVADINKYYLGVWSFGFSSLKSDSSLKGFFDFFEEYSGQNKKDSTKSFFKTKTQLQGSRLISFQDFQSVSVWSLLQDYSNPDLNESYTCYRVAPDGYVYPSVVIRQKPFNTKNYSKKGPISVHTRYLDLPRWKISSDLILNLNIGRSDQGRINFVQVFSRALSIDSKFDAAQQITSGNFVENKLDVKRHGRKPYIVNCNYDPPSSTKPTGKAREWAYLISDWVFDGHLKLNGTIQTIGIEEPICVGDNLELDNIVYHIESISHTISINENGNKTFKSSFSLSMGVDDRSNENIPVYGEMDYPDSYKRRKDDFEKEKLLPGFSDSQDIPGRDNGEKTEESTAPGFTNPGSPTGLKNKGNKK